MLIKFKQSEAPVLNERNNGERVRVISYVVQTTIAFNHL